jgi:endonuclease/exonuclease/phosphatase family metal-dependent hydrolase
LFDAWTLAHPGQPHAPTFQLFDRCYRPAPITVDYVLVSDGLRTRVRRVDVDLQTQSSDHQSVLIELG